MIRAEQTEKGNHSKFKYFILMLGRLDTRSNTHFIWICWKELWIFPLKSKRKINSVQKNSWIKISTQSSHIETCWFQRSDVFQQKKNLFLVVDDSQEFNCSHMSHSHYEFEFITHHTFENENITKNKNKNVVN